LGARLSTDGKKPKTAHFLNVNEKKTMGNLGRGKKKVLYRGFGLLRGTAEAGRA